MSAAQPQPPLEDDDRSGDEQDRPFGVIQGDDSHDQKNKVREFLTQAGWTWITGAQLATSAPRWMKSFSVSSVWSSDPPHYARGRTCQDRPCSRIFCRGIARWLASLHIRTGQDMSGLFLRRQPAK